MKRLHWFITKSFLGPFFLTFFICIFILLMQFLWKYIDDLVGKGLEWNIIAEFLTYASFALVPMAFPLAMLLASIMAFGSMGENYELVAMKASGISLIKAMRPVDFYSRAFYLCRLFLCKQHIATSQPEIHDDAVKYKNTETRNDYKRRGFCKRHRWVQHKS